MAKKIGDVPAHVGGYSQQQFHPPSGENRAHPELKAVKTESFRKPRRPGSHYDGSTKRAMGCGKREIRFAQFGWNSRSDLQSKRRHHQQNNERKIEKH